MRVKDAGGAISEGEARSIAARSLGLAGDALQIVGSTPGVRIFQPSGDGLRPVRAVDREGTIRVQRSRALVRTTNAGAAVDSIAALWREAAAAADGGHASAPGLIMMFGRHVADLSGVETLEQAQALATAELEGQGADVPAALIALPRHA
jgi:hypothetical protein